MLYCNYMYKCDTCELPAGFCVLIGLQITAWSCCHVYIRSKTVFVPIDIVSLCVRSAGVLGAVVRVNGGEHGLEVDMLSHHVARAHCTLNVLRKY